jgi:signal transduction histidine kinase
MSDLHQVGRGVLGRSLSVFAAALISWSIVAGLDQGTIAAWVLVAGLAANAAWVVLLVLPLRAQFVSAFCLAIMVTGGGLTAAATGGTSLVPAAIAVLWLTRDTRLSTTPGLVLGFVTMVIVIVGDVLTPVSLLGATAMEAGVIVGFLAGLSRRQFVVAELRARELVEEQARTDVLSARAQLASEIHDVLAHSLGGLVIQLDAVDALLESGNTDAAAAKVRDARALAADCLGEARRAVAALSESPADGPALVAAAQVVDDLSAFVAAHVSLGGTAELSQIGVGHDVSKPVDLALRRAVQEGLTNARKHAPGAGVDVVLRWNADSVQLEISNPVGATPGPSTPGPPTGGHGLVGMRERFAALPGGAASVERAAGRFVVTVRAGTR